MKKLTTILIVAFVLSTSCRKDDETGINTMTISTYNQSVSFKMDGFGEVSIDWGDDTEIENYFLPGSQRKEFSHVYSKSTTHSITITGESITYLDCNQKGVFKLDVTKNTALAFLNCGYNKLTSLDVRKNPALKDLYCYMNQLKDLDLSKNPSLEYVSCYSNQLTKIDVSYNLKLHSLMCENNKLSAKALNDLFETLHHFKLGRTKVVSIPENAGAADCDKTIAEDKGWRVNMNVPYIP